MAVRKPILVSSRRPFARHPHPEIVITMHRLLSIRTDTKFFPGPYFHNVPQVLADDRDWILLLPNGMLQW